MKIYIDTECKCHTTNPDSSFHEVILSEGAKTFFDNKCIQFIEGYRYCPKGESYTREDGEVFYGECIVLYKNYDELNEAQRQYEQQLLVEYKIKENELNNSYQEGVNSI